MKDTKKVVAIGLAVLLAGSIVTAGVLGSRLSGQNQALEASSSALQTAQTTLDSTTGEIGRAHV